MGQYFRVRAVFPFAVVVLFLVALYIATPAASTRGLYAEPPIADLEDISQGKHRTTFRLTNDYPFAVRILGVRRSCDCADIHFPKVLPPSATSEVSVVWDTRMKSGRTSTTVRLLYSRQPDTQHPKIANMASLMLTVTGNVEPTIQVAPDALAFEEGIAKTRTLRLHAQGAGDAVVVERATTTHEAFTARLAEDGRTVHVEFDPTAWNYSFRPEYLIVYTSAVNHKVCRVPLLTRK